MLSYLTNRKAWLFFDGKLSKEFLLMAGVPQGSPLSPILFIRFIATIYEALMRVKGLVVVGFADDTNLLALMRDTPSNCKVLEEGWKICKKWADERGMEFEPKKSILMHFTRTRKPRDETVQFGEATLKPVEDARFLGVWLDRKFNFKAHKQAVKKKLATQTFALTRLASKTWGVNFARARQIYAVVIRSAISYGASAWHATIPKGGTPKGIARYFSSDQSKCLCVVAGAYKATPVRDLEVETDCVPIDLYLNLRVAEFERKHAESAAGS